MGKTKKESKTRVIRKGTSSGLYLSDRENLLKYNNSDLKSKSVGKSVLKELEASIDSTIHSTTKMSSLYMGSVLDDPKKGFVTLMSNIQKSAVGLRTKFGEVTEEKLGFYNHRVPHKYDEDFTQLEWVAYLNEGFYRESLKYPNPARWRMRRLGEMWAYPYVAKNGDPEKLKRFELRETILKMYDSQFLWSCLVSYLKEYADKSGDPDIKKLFLQVSTFIYDKDETPTKMKELEEYLRDYCECDFVEEPSSSELIIASDDEDVISVGEDLFA